MVMREYFNVYGGNSGLTESIIYWNPPKNRKRTIVVYSGATLGTTLMGNVDSATMINGKSIKTFTAPAIVIVRKGLAGQTKYIASGKFTINDDAYVIKVKDKYIEKIDVEWFEKNIHRYIEACITSRGTNGTFSKEQFLDTDFTYPSMIEQKKIVDIYKSIDDLNGKVFALCERIKKLNGYVIEGVTEFQKEAGKLFDIKGGNSGLTEEFIYNNQPINEEDAIVVYSSSTDETTNMGVISKNSKLKGENIKFFKGPAAIIARNGQAGKVMFIEKGMFTINDHAYVLTVKPAYKKTIALEWFVDVAEKYTKNCVTSKDANGTFSKEVFLKEEIDVPEYSIQKKIVKKKKGLKQVYSKLNLLLKVIEGNEIAHVGISADMI